MNQENCTSADIFHFLSKRWVLPLMCAINNGTHTFNELKKVLEGISPRTLSERLKEMEQMKLVERKIISDYPIKTEYHLSEKAKSFEPILKDIEEWAKNWQAN